MAKTVKKDRDNVMKHVDTVLKNNKDAVEESINTSIINQIRAQDNMVRSLTDTVNDIVAKNQAE